MTVRLHWSGNAADAVDAIVDRFKLMGAWSRVAPLEIGDVFDDLEIEQRCERLERDLGINLELPLTLLTFGDLAAYCTRQLLRKETRMIEKAVLACPVSGCKGMRRDITMLMCWPCWRHVPKLLKNAVWDAYRAWQRQADFPRGRALQQAQRQAIAAVDAWRAEGRHERRSRRVVRK